MTEVFGRIEPAWRRTIVLKMVTRFEALAHPHAAAILDLGVADANPTVQNTALEILPQMARRDFAADRRAYES